MCVGVTPAALQLDDDDHIHRRLWRVRATAPPGSREGIERGRRYPLAGGEGRLDESGRRVTMQVKAGDTVLLAKCGGTEEQLDDLTSLILSEQDIRAIIQSE